MELRHRMDYWIGGGTHDRWFHGWPNHRDFRNCFVFKWRLKGRDQRCYGFLCNPKRRTDPSFQLCVLCCHAVKSERESDPKLLRVASTLAEIAAVREAIVFVYPDTATGEKEWLN